MNRTRQHEMEEAKVTRHPDRVFTVQVPCSMADGRGRHPLTFALAGDGTLLHISSPCSHPENYEYAEAAERMSQDTCLGWLQDFLKVSRNKRSTTRRLDTDSVLKALAEQAAQATSANVGTAGRTESKRKVRKPIAQLGPEQRNRLAARVMSRHLNTAVPLGEQRFEKWGDVEPAFRVHPHREVVYQDGTAVRTEEGGNVYAYQLHFQVNGTDGYRTVGSIERQAAGGWKLKVDADQLRRQTDELLITRGGTCVACQREYEGPKRHGKSPKHRTHIGAIMRQARRAVASINHASRAPAATGAPVAPRRGRRKP